MTRKVKSSKHSVSMIIVAILILFVAQFPFQCFAQTQSVTNIGSITGGYLSKLFSQIFSGNLGGNTVPSQAPAKFNFGGKLTVMTYPYCSATCGYPGFSYVNIGPPKGGLFVIPPTVKKYMNANVSTGSWVIGEYSPGGSCSMRVGKVCVPLPAQGYITRIGTS